MSNDLSAAIGVRVRAARTGRGWTLEQLADAAGVSRRLVVNIEAGHTNPSIGTLLRLAEALAVSLPLLVEAPRISPINVTRAGSAACLWETTNSGRASLVASTGDRDAFELWDWTLGTGDERSSEAHRTGTHELLLVLEGTVAVRSGGTEEVLLQRGDSAAFRGDLAHSYRNPGERPARFVLAVLEPDPIPAAL